MPEAQLGRIVAFGDEIGLARAIAAAKSEDVDLVAVVIDPKRASAANHSYDLPENCQILMHPTPDGREEFMASLRALAPSLGVVNSYSRILWQELLDIFPLGVVNIHNGKLPQYRGANPIQWAIINDERETAATLHYMVAEVDAGAVIDAIDIAIEQEDSALDLRDKLIAADDVLLRRWLVPLSRARVEAREQEEALACVRPRRTPEDGRIDWAMSDKQVSALTRALVSPWPGAFYEDAYGVRHVIDWALRPEDVASLRREVKK